MSDDHQPDHSLATLCRDSLWASDRHAAQATQQPHKYQHFMWLSGEFRRIAAQVYQTTEQQQCVLPPDLVKRFRPLPGNRSPQTPQSTPA